MNEGNNSLYCIHNLPLNGRHMIYTTEKLSTSFTIIMDKLFPIQNYRETHSKIYEYKYNIKGRTQIF
jgi:hypothetical protein